LSNSSVSQPPLPDPAFSEPLRDAAPALPTVPHPAHERMVAAAEAALCSGLPTQYAISVLLQIAGWSPTDAAGHLSFPFVLTLTMADTLVLVVLMVALTRMHGQSATELWLGSRRVRTEVALGVLLVPIAFIGVVVLLNTLRLTAPWLHNVADNPLERLAGTATDAAMFALVAIVAGGVREELQRAFLLFRFERFLGGPGVGVVVTSAAFGAAHTLQGWDVAITTGALGAFWAIVYLRRRSSVAPIVSHAGFNALEILRVSVTT
jgi:membrane protease YdiL (CAAX protease family)